MISKKRY